MKTLTRILLALACLGLTTAVAHAQVVSTSTTLSANVTATQTELPVTANTGYVAGAFLYIDAEQMLIRSISGTTRVTVQRGVNGTAARAHDNAERVILALTADHFHTNPPDYGQDCTRGEGQAAYSPWIDVRANLLWVCPQGLTAWRATTTANVVFDSIPTSF